MAREKAVLARVTTLLEWRITLRGICLEEALLKPPPGIAAATPELTHGCRNWKPVHQMEISWLVTARPLLSVCVAACNPVGSHRWTWLGVEMRRDGQGEGGLGSGDHASGMADHPVCDSVVGEAIQP